MLRLNRQFDQLDEKTLEEIVKKLREGKATFEDKECLYNSHVKLAIAIAKDYKYKVPQKIREDIYSEALLALSKAIDEAPKKLVNDDFTKFSKYRIMTIIRNFIRQETKQNIIRIECFNDTTEELARLDFDQNNFDLEEEIKKTLSSRTHRIIVKYLTEGYTQQEIAHKMKVSKSRINRYCAEIKEKILKRGNLK